eukprot:scaffold43132_cov130-Amphora_coffeaeformis.AAC.1
MKPIPDNVKEILGQLPGPQQVALRTYIAALRSEIKDLEAELLAKNDVDPHAHYHGHEKVRWLLDDDDVNRSVGGIHHANVSIT